MSNYSSLYSGGPYSYDVPRPTNILEHLLLLRWYSETKLAASRLYLIALNIDDPEWIEETEKEWLNERKYWNGYYGQTSRLVGFYGDWDEDWNDNDKKNWE